MVLAQGDTQLSPRTGPRRALRGQESPRVTEQSGEACRAEDRPPERPSGKLLAQRGVCSLLAGQRAARRGREEEARAEASPCRVW